jgi:sugar O-acyltransferase (sialic acid O-acetyltransferase NeuD family)
MKKLLLVGGGGHCRSCIDVIEAEGRFEIIGILDVKEKAGGSVFGYPVVGTDEDIPQLKDKTEAFFITIGQNTGAALRREKYRMLSEYGKLPVIVSPFARCSAHAEVQEGSIVMHRAMINAGAVVGCNCIINSGALIEHDAVIGGHCHVSTLAAVNGSCSIGEGCFIGSGAVVNNNISICSGAVVASGAVIIKNITEPAVYAGVPARKVREIL